MSTLVKTSKTFFVRLSLIGLIVLLSFLFESYAQGQTDSNIALQGSLATSVTDGVDVFSGQLEQILMLMNIQGRGGIKEGLYLPIRNSQWRVLEAGTSENNGKKYYYYKADQTNYVNNFARAGYETLGKFEVETKFTGWNLGQTASVTEVRFTSNKGSIIRFRDVLTNGQPYDVGARGCALSGYQPPNPPAACSRGRVFRAIDGSNALFVADADIYDMIFYDFWGNPTTYTVESRGAGTIYLSNGSRVRIENVANSTFSNVARMTDRSGNYMTFEYVNELTNNYHFLKKITDSLNREITISYGDDTQPSYFDEIIYKGFGESEKRIRINYTGVGNVMAPGQSLGVALFPGVHTRCYYLSSGDPCDPTPAGGVPGGSYATSIIVPSSIVLPNGQEYRFYYNNYLELARIKYPMGSYTDYNYSGLIGAGDDGFTEPVSGGGDIYRRVSSVRNFDETGQLINEKTFSNIPQLLLGSTPPYIDNVTIDVRDGNGTVLSKSKHYFYDSISLLGWYTFLPASYGKEYKTEALDPVSQTVLRRTETTWEQRALFPWCPNGFAFNSIYICDNTTSPLSAPAVDPRITEVKTTLETGQVRKTSYSYDQYNNVTDTYEYDYGSGQAGPLLRRSHTDYVTDPNYTNYTTAYLLRLPSQSWISSDLNGDNKASFAQREYDNYSSDANHAPLMLRWSITGFDGNFLWGVPQRGNPTAETHFSNAQNQTGPVTHYSQYDILGNLVKSIDPRGFVTTIDYSDRFGSPNGEARGNWDTVQMPAQLNGQSTFAFATSSTDALGHISYAQYDYSTGSVVDAEDINQSVTTSFYNDALDRRTQIITANNDPNLRNQKSFTFDDPNRLVTVRSDLRDFGDNLIKSETLYNSLGQVSEARTYEPGGYVVVKSEYDALGRKLRTSNPFRPWNVETPVWTTSSYDTLSRVISVTTPDNAVVTTSYSGNQLTVTDQAGKQRRSVTDALRRLTQVYEDPNSLNYLTSYSYDAIDDLITVNQGSQARNLVYDSLKRLISATNPESGNITYQFDENGNLLVKTDARGVSAHYSYDALNRVIRRWYNGSSALSATTNNSPALPWGVATSDEVTYSYDSTTNGNGRLASVSSSVSTYSYSGYDLIGRALGGTQTIGAQTYSMSYSYDLASHIKSINHPSRHVVNYNYDTAGRLADKDAQNLAFTGNLGDGATRTYSTGITYTSSGKLAQEQFGTSTYPVYDKLFYNSRQQLAEILVSTTSNDPGFNRGKIVNDYSDQCSGASCNGTDNNGNLRKQSVYIPNDDQNTSPTSWYQRYDYDNLNRLGKVREFSSVGTLLWQQSYVMDRYGNRTIDPANTTDGIPKLNFGVDVNTNRLTVPSGQNGAMSYDNSGNLTTDTYSAAAVTRAYDAENRMSSETQANSFVAGSYSYDGDGRRVKRNVGGFETWQIYGIGGELLAEYAANSNASTPQKEYGYRGGEMLITASVTNGWGASPVFNDNPLVAGVTTVQSRHISELRSAINVLRVHMGMSAWQWQYSATTNDYVSANPILEMRTALDQALGAPSGGYGAGLAQGQPVKAVHIQELRDRVSAAWVTSSSTDLRWLVSDQLGTPRIVLDQGGSLANVSRHDYLPFGEELLAGIGARTSPRGYTGDSLRQKFTGYEADSETALNFAQARYQSSAQGRFTSPDPVGGMATEPQSFNAYSYVMNNPLNSVDPTGLWGTWYDSFDVEVGTGNGFYIDGLAAQFSQAAGLLSSGAGVQGPLNMWQYDSDKGTFEHLTAIETSIGTAEGYIPQGAKYIGELCWGWTDLSKPPYPSYTYTFTEQRLSKLFYWGGEFVFDRSGVYWSVYGSIVGEHGLDMNPVIDPVWMAAGLIEGITRGLGKAAIQEEVEREILVKSEHFFARHFANTALTEVEVNAAIKQSVQTAVRGASSTGQFWGRTTIRGVLVEYRAYTVAGRIEIATAYPWPVR